MIDRAPQVHMLAGDPDDHLIEMPAIARPRTPTPQPSCDNRPEFQHPAAHRLVRDIEPALGEKLLHIPVAHGEPEVQPDLTKPASGPARALTSFATWQRSRPRTLEPPKSSRQMNPQPP